MSVTYRKRIFFCKACLGCSVFQHVLALFLSCSNRRCQKTLLLHSGLEVCISDEGPLRLASASVIAPHCLSPCNCGKCNWKCFYLKAIWQRREEIHLLFQGLCVFLGEACLWNVSFYPWIASWEISFGSAKPEWFLQLKAWAMIHSPNLLHLLSSHLLQAGRLIHGCVLGAFFFYRKWKEICIFYQQYWAIFITDV